MKKIPPTVCLVLIAALACFALNADALTVGRLRGSALLGQPFEAAASVQLAQDEDSSAVCIEAAVAYGDVPQPAGQTVVKVVPGPQNQTVLALITSSGIVNEPVVTLDLKVGCAQKTTRRFVLLAELASDSSGTSTPPAVASRTPAAPVVLPASPKSAAAAATKPAGSGPIAASRTTATAKAPKADSKPTSSEKRAGGSVAPNSAATLSNETVEDLKRRIEAVAQWQAAKAAEPELQSHGQSIDLLQDNLKLLQAVTIKNQKSIEAVSNALETSESQRLSPSVVYGLLMLVVMTLGAMGYVLFRSGRSGQSSTPWWGTSAGVQTQVPEKVGDSEGAEKAAVQSLATQTQQLPVTINPIGGKPAPDAVDIELGESAFAGLPPAAAAKSLSPKTSEPKRADKRDFAQSGSASLRAINTKEMFDVRQQADFFMALGQHDEAIKVLERSNSESEESNPLVLLDLLKILHTLSRREGFDRYRSEFNALFTGVVPAYTSFLDEGKSLESYVDIVNQIADLWPSDEAMDYIEQCMVRTPEDDPDQGFDLQAFRDLLTLHAMLRRLANDADSALAPFSANRTMAGVLATDTSDSDLVPLPELPPAPSSLAAPNLDLDLTDNNGTNLMDFDINGIGGVDKPKA